MKTVWIILGLVFSTSLAQAECPSYNGKFLCKGQGIEQQLTLKTEVKEGVYQYSLDDTTVVADGVNRPVNFQGGIYDMAATCEASKVTVKIVFPGGEGDNEACGTEK
jgi:hypothetical protein